MEKNPSLKDIIEAHIKSTTIIVSDVRQFLRMKLVRSHCKSGLVLVVARRLFLKIPIHAFARYNVRISIEATIIDQDDIVK